MKIATYNIWNENKGVRDRVQLVLDDICGSMRMFWHYKKSRRIFTGNSCHPCRSTRFPGL